MAKMLSFRVKVVTILGDKVAISGSHSSLGIWDPRKIVFLNPPAVFKDSDIWTLSLEVPTDCSQIEYRYLVCRNCDGRNTHTPSVAIRHWESGTLPRIKDLSESAGEEKCDFYGELGSGNELLADQGWLINESEIQMRFFRNPITVFQKSNSATTHMVKCTGINLRNVGITDSFLIGESPAIRVTSLGKYSNVKQAEYGIPIGADDYIIYKFRTSDVTAYGIKVEFYEVAEDEKAPRYQGYSNFFPGHLSECNGTAVLVISDLSGLPIGEAKVGFLICKPCLDLPCDLSVSYTRCWQQSKPTIDIGHRGLGKTRDHRINSMKPEDRGIRHENTLVSLMAAGQVGADYVEFDVMLTKDMVPVLWHDFKVSVLLRKITRGHHRAHTPAVHEFSYDELKDLCVEFVHDTDPVHHVDELADDSSRSNNISPFPSLKEALETVDENVGFYVEVKYPQLLYGGKSLEEGIESTIERNKYLDPILKDLFQYGGKRRILIASFDPDICIMARLKQNRYPVFYLIDDQGTTKDPYFHDVRAQSVSSAVSMAISEKFMGLSVNAGAFLRNEEKLLEKVLGESLVCLVWGKDANDLETRKCLTARGVHGICYDEIWKDGGPKSASVAHLNNQSNVTGSFSDSSVDKGVSVHLPYGRSSLCQQGHSYDYRTDFY